MSEGDISSASPAAAVTAPPEFRALACKVSPWTQDKTKCFVCGVKFTWLNHRHVCGNCREFVCHSCSLGRKVLRAYTAPKRVCDPCVGKYWTPKAPTPSISESAAVVKKDDDPSPLPRPSLAVETEDSPDNGQRPSTAPLSVSPSNPMLDGGFFAGGSELNDGQMDMAPMPGEEEELEEVGAADVIELAAVVASPPRTPARVLCHDGEEEKGAADMEHSAFDDNAAKSRQEVCGDNVAESKHHAYGGNAVEAVLPAEVALLYEAALADGMEVLAAGGDGARGAVSDGTEAKIISDGNNAGRGGGLLDEGRDRYVASVPLESVIENEKGKTSTRGDTAVRKATATEEIDDDELLAPVPDLFSFYVGVGVGLLTAAVGYGVGLFIRYWH